MNVALKVKVKHLYWLDECSDDPKTLNKEGNLYFIWSFIQIYFWRETNRALPSLGQKCVLAVLTIYKIYTTEIILTLTHHTQRQVWTVNIIMSTSLLGFSWPDKFTAEFSEESQTLVYVKSSEL